MRCGIGAPGAASVRVWQINYVTVTGPTDEAPAPPEGGNVGYPPPWRGNVRELETTLEQAMIFRRGDWITPEDLDLPAQRPTEVPGGSARAGRQGVAAAKATLNWLQHEVLRIAAEHREVRRRDVIAQCRVSHEVARRALAGLVRLRLLRRVGLGRAARYVPLSCWLTLMRDVAEWLAVLV